MTSRFNEAKDFVDFRVRKMGQSFFLSPDGVHWSKPAVIHP